MERGQVIRLDNTTTDTTIHEPTDSSLLWDSVRVLVRLFDQTQAIEGVPALPYRNHQRRAKKRMRAIRYTRSQDKKAKLYQDLLQVTRMSLLYRSGLSNPGRIIGRTCTVCRVACRSEALSGLDFTVD